ncbi:MAG: hypothetical protein ABIW83_02640, partial [Allosphingosinicella sp.]
PVAGLAQHWLDMLRGEAEPGRGVGHRLAVPLSWEAGLDPDPMAGAEARLGPAADVIAPEASPELRLAKMVELMAGFGAQGGEGPLQPSAAALNPRFDYFA